MAGTDNFIIYLESLFEGEQSATTALESVDISNHMLQTAAAAQAAGARDSLVAAALLHDIGHWIDRKTDLALVPEEDRRHEDIAAERLAPHFGPEVCQPVQLHVAAKRYLCAVEPEYFAKLSPGSVHSLNLQGGPMTEEEIRAFEAIPEHRDAVKLRRWDEYGKAPETQVPPFSHYRELLHSLAR